MPEVISKISTRIAVVCFLLFALFIFAGQAAAQDKDDLVDIESFIPGVAIDIRYATVHNFIGAALYPEARCYLRREVAEHLRIAQEELKKRGLCIKVLDCYRPLSVQKKMWAYYPFEGFVANPAKGSRHNRGAAVDLTLVDKNGKELDMGTPYDDFTEQAGRSFKKLPRRVLKNRRVLESVMVKNDFIPLYTEWWHYDYKDWQKYGILDVDFTQLREGQNNSPEKQENVPAPR